MSAGLVRLCFATLIACSAARLEAAAVSSEDVPLPGGTAALASALGIDPVPDRGRFLFEITRLIYDSAESRRPAAQAFLESLRLQGNRARHSEYSERSSLDRVAAPAGSVARRCPDIGRLRALTGFVPKVSLEVGVRDTIAWYRDCRAWQGEAR